MSCCSTIDHHIWKGGRSITPWFLHPIPEGYREIRTQNIQTEINNEITKLFYKIDPATQTQEVLLIFGEPWDCGLILCTAILTIIAKTYGKLFILTSMTPRKPNHIENYGRLHPRYRKIRFRIHGKHNNQVSPWSQSEEDKDVPRGIFRGRIKAARCLNLLRREPLSSKLSRPLSMEP